MMFTDWNGWKSMLMSDLAKLYTCALYSRHVMVVHTICEQPFSWDFLQHPLWLGGLIAASMLATTLAGASARPSQDA